MVRPPEPGGHGNDELTTTSERQTGSPNERPASRRESVRTPDERRGRKPPVTGRGRSEAGASLLGRRTVLRSVGVAALGAAGLRSAARPASASVEERSGNGFEVWTVSDMETYELSDDEELSNVLIDQTADGATMTIRADDASGWTVRNVGFLGVGQDGEGSHSYQLQVSVPSGGTGRIENVWANGKARDGQEASELGCIYLRSSHAGHVDIRHTYIEGFGNNAVYASAVGKDGGENGSVALQNCYHRDNTVSQYRIGSPGSSVRNCVGIVDDPDGERGAYPYSGDQTARGIWGKHFDDQRIVNSSFYMSPDDVDPDAAFAARYIDDRSHGDEAVVQAVGCHVNADAPTVTDATDGADVTMKRCDEQPTVAVIGGGGVPLSPQMAARGKRKMPPEIPSVPGR